MTVITVIALIVPAAHGQFVGRWTQPAPTPSPTPIAGTDNTLIQDVEKNKPLYASQYNAIINATNAFIDGWVLSSDTLNHATYNGIITHNRDRMSGATFAITDTLQINNKLTTNNRLFGAAQTTRPHIWNKIISKNDRIFDTSPTAIPHVWHTAGVMHIIA